MNYSEIFNKLDVHGQGYLCKEQVKEFCEQCFLCTVDSQRVEEAISRVCGHHHCTREFLRDVISEVIKIVKLEKSIRWEFRFLDKNESGRISLSDALFLFKTVQGSGFSLAGWQLFLSQRSNRMHNYITCDELLQQLLSDVGRSSPASNTLLAGHTSYEDYVSNKKELSRMALERKWAIYNDLQKLVAEISDDDNDDFFENVLGDNEADNNMSLVDKAAERLENIKQNGLNAFNFKPPIEDTLCEDHTTSVDATKMDKEHKVDDETNFVLEQTDAAKEDALKSVINKLVLALYKSLAEKLMADLVICNHADVPRVESLQNDYTLLLSQLPSDLRQIKEFSVDKWTTGLDKLFDQCGIHIYCLALLEADHELSEIFSSKLTCSEKFLKLVKWLGSSYSQEIIAVEKSLSQNCDLAAVRKILLQLCFIMNAVQWEPDFISALVMSKLLQLSFKEEFFISQHKESSTLSLLHLLLASVRISPVSSSNVSATSLCCVHNVLPEDMTEYLQNMALEVATHRDRLKCEDFVRVLKSKNLSNLMKKCSTNSIDSALLKYKELKVLSFESGKKSTTCSHEIDITGDDVLMEGLAIRCHLISTHKIRNTGTNCFLDTGSKLLADLQKLQVNNILILLDKINQEDLNNCSEMVETAEHNFTSLISEVVFPSEDLLVEQFCDTSVYTEIIMGIKTLYMSSLHCLFWHSLETTDSKFKFLSSLGKHKVLSFVMEKINFKASNSPVLLGPIKGNLITKYFKLLKHFCSERVATLEEVQVSVHSNHKEFATMQELINDFYAANKEEPVLLQASEAYHIIHQCMELEISLFRSAEKYKGHVTLSSEFGAALAMALICSQHQEISNEVDPSNAMCLLAQGLHLRHFDGSYYKCEASLLQCFLAYNLLTKPLEITKNCSIDNEYEPLRFSSHARVSRCKALFCTIKEQSSYCINLLQSILLYIKCGQPINDSDASMELNRIFFLITKLHHQRSLANQIKELIGDQIYFQCLLARQNYVISSSDERWVVLFWVLTLLDQQQWNLFAFVASKAIKEVDTISKKLTKHYHQMNSLLVTLCHLPPSKCVVFQYLDVMKFHIISALQSKYNAILSKLPHLSEQDDNQDKFSVQTEWLAKFWFVQKSGGFDKLSTSGHSSVIVPLTCPWQLLINMHMEENEESNKLSCTIKEVTSALGESFSFELEQILEQSKHPDQNEAAFCRCQLLRVYWEQLHLQKMPTFETSFILLSILKSLHTSNIKSKSCKDQLQKLAQLKSHEHSFTATDVTTASANVSSLITYVEKSVRAEKKSGMSIDNLATFGDFFLHTPYAIASEIIRKHKFEEEAFVLLCGTICEAQITELTHEEDALEKLRLDRQQWRLSAEVIGAETQDFTSTITGVLILDENQIKKREGHIKLLQKALMINLANTRKEISEQADCKRLLQNKMINLLAQLIQVQLDEANTTIGKLLRMTAKSQRAVYNENRMALVQCWLDNIAAVLLGIDPVQNRLMSKTMRLNLQQGRQLNEKLQRKKEGSVKARRKVMRIKRQASLSPYASEDDHGSTSSFLSALEDESPQEVCQTALPELSFQAQLKMMAQIEKEFQSEKMKILLQLEEQQNKMEVLTPLKPRRQSKVTSTNTPEGSHQHLRARAKSAGAQKIKERMKKRKRQKLARMETELDYDGFVENPQETTYETSTDETITKLSQLERIYEEKKKKLLSSMQ